MDNLHSLPDGAIYSNSSGQATTSVYVKGDSIYITATCDSLQQLVWSYERELAHIRDETTSLAKESTPSESPFKWFVYGLLAGVIISIIVVIIIKLKRKW